MDHFVDAECHNCHGHMVRKEEPYNSSDSERIVCMMCSRMEVKEYAIRPPTHAERHMRDNRGRKPETTWFKVRGDVVKEVMRARHIPPSKIAKALGCHVKSIYDYLRGRCGTTKRRLDTIASVLKVPVETITQTERR
jgi:hypothetical protein